MGLVPSVAWSLCSQCDAGRPAGPGAAGPGRGESHTKLPVPLLLLLEAHATPPPHDTGVIYPRRNICSAEDLPDPAFPRGDGDSKSSQVTQQDQG